MTTGFAGDEVKASEQFEARGDQRGSPASQNPRSKLEGRKRVRRGLGLEPQEPVASRKASPRPCVRSPLSDSTWILTGPIVPSRVCDGVGREV
ncbi:hypothetical protein MUK42_37407 [Musa troglodytarum]|uniref:Uncharacterized protein n=1 Tax=Musa troglodytarum TaxID=320322 RepID=A0A9E7JCK7_9LILI|nr:hypothetical protein MUK42_37407 [Musa troglodytarum]